VLHGPSGAHHWLTTAPWGVYDAAAAGAVRLRARRGCELARSILRVPKTQQAALGRLVTLDAEHHQALSRVLANLAPASSLKSFAEHVAEKMEFSSGEAFELVRVLANMYTVRDRERVAPAEFLNEVERAAKETEKPELLDPPGGWAAARERIGELLSHTHSLGVTAKAHDVLQEHERLFCDARVLTDFRPVFAADIGQTPDALVLVHDLRISYHEQDGTLKTVFIAMDSDSVEELRQVLDRASSKEATLERLAAGTSVPVLKSKSHGG
jgi:hypothetical protein